VLGTLDRLRRHVIENSSSAALVSMLKPPS